MRASVRGASSQCRRSRGSYLQSHKIAADLQSCSISNHGEVSCKDHGMCCANVHTGHISHSRNEASPSEGSQESRGSRRSLQVGFCIRFSLGVCPSSALFEYMIRVQVLFESNDRVFLAELSFRFYAVLDSIVLLLRKSVYSILFFKTPPTRQSQTFLLSRVATSRLATSTLQQLCSIVNGPVLLLLPLQCLFRGQPRCVFDR